MIKTLAVSCCSLAFLLTTAQAGELLPMAAQVIALGSVSGVAYYTVQPDGYRVVATLAGGPESTSIRYIATLVPGQSVLVSVPQAVNEPPLEVAITRNGDTVSVGDQAAVAVAME